MARYVLRYLWLLLLMVLVMTPAFAGCSPELSTGRLTPTGCPVSLTSGPLLLQPQSAAQPAGSSAERSLPRNILLDQKWFWTRPAHLQTKDLKWLLPFSGITAGLIAGDTHIEQHLPDSPAAINNTRVFSNFAVAGMAGASGGFYLWGRWRNDSHARETGLLSGEALAGSFIVAEVLKLATQRERPLEHDGDGSFWQGGSSFPSQHAVAAWSVAEVVSEEYPYTITRVLSYGMATAISVTRVTGRRHFSSDVFVGGALGWYFGRHVFRTHHAPADARFGRFVRTCSNQ